MTKLSFGEKEVDKSAEGTIIKTLSGVYKVIAATGKVIRFTDKQKRVQVAPIVFCRSLQTSRVLIGKGQMGKVAQSNERLVDLRDILSSLQDRVPAG